MDKKAPIIVFQIQTPKRTATIRLAGPFFVLGRGEPYRIFHEDPTLSREHLAVVSTDDGYRVKDLGSRNGVFLNGKRLDRYGEADLSLGDVLLAGTTKVQLVLQQEKADVDEKVTVDEAGRSTAIGVRTPQRDEDEELGGEVTGTLERPDLGGEPQHEDDLEGDDLLADAEDDAGLLEDLERSDPPPEEVDEDDPERTQIALDEEYDGLLPEEHDTPLLPEVDDDGDAGNLDSLTDAIDAASEPREHSELELDTVASDLGVSPEELEAELDEPPSDDLDELVE